MQCGAETQSVANVVEKKPHVRVVYRTSAVL
jgi:hypothetical protein